MTAALHKPQFLETGENAFFRARLFAADFDETIALTNETAPGIVGVEEAYNIAINEVFGVEALTKYMLEGGLQGRAPIDVVRQLAPDAADTETLDILQKLDATKLSILEDQISPTWPKPSGGFLELSQMIEKTQGTGLPIDTMIISSGHATFISKTYAAWGVKPPEIILAQEAILVASQKAAIEMPSKPDSVIMQFAYDAWRRKFDLNPIGTTIKPQDAFRMLYVGDNMVMDGQLAASACIKFVHIEQRNSVKVWGDIAHTLKLGDLVVGGGSE